MPSVPVRADVPAAATWNHEAVFPSFAAWREAYSETSAALAELASYPGTLGQGPARLAEYFVLQQSLARRVSTLFMYAYMWQACDGNHEEMKGMVGQAQSLSAQFSAATAFAEPELLDMDPGDLRVQVQTEAALQAYEHYVDDLLRSKDHVLSSEVEAALGALSDPLSRFSSIRGALNDMDLRFEDALSSSGERQPLVQSTRDKLLSDSDRATRKSAWCHYADSYLAFHNSFASAYLASVKRDVTLARLRGYDSVLQMKLAPDNIPLEVFHNLQDSYRAHLPTWHRYWDVRRRALGYERIHPWDIWAPLTANAPQLSFVEAVEMIAVGMVPLGADYVETMRRGCLSQRWVDYAINDGKSEGAFSYGSYDSQPYIMMSFDGNLSSMSTLAHELGHSMHSHYTRSSQPYINSDYSMFVAEVASNFNQALVRAHFFAQGNDRDFQLALIQEAFDNLHRYFFIMPTLARFEYEVHSRIERGEPLTPAALNEIMAGFFALGYGETMTDDPRRTGITWAQFGHLYRAYYTFQYATGISAAHSLAGAILDGDADAVPRYLGFLRAGNSEYPIRCLQAAGVDMSSPRPVQETFQVLERLVDRLESLI